MNALIKVLLCVLTGITLYCSKARPERQIKIGAYYADALNGITFILDDREAVLLRVGWIDSDNIYRNGYESLKQSIEKFGMAAPDGSINRVRWHAGEAAIQFDWGKCSKTSVVGRIRAGKPVKIILEMNQPWEFKPRFGLTETGAATVDGPEPMMTWQLRTVQRPVSRICVDSSAEMVHQLVTEAKSMNDGVGRNSALVFELDEEKALEFTAGYDSLAAPADISSLLDSAVFNYRKERVQALGQYGNFIEPITNSLNNSKVYNFKTKRIAHTVSRGWCKDDRAGGKRPDGQVLFAWDSFFNALLASIEDRRGAKNTIRAILATQLDNGMIPGMSGARRWTTTDRSQLPVGSMCVWKIHQRWPDREFLAETYEKLKHWHAWWFSIRPSNGLPYRDGNKNGLLELGSETGFFLDAKYEGGGDDSPAVDFARMNNKTYTMELDAVGLNAIWAMDAEYLALIAGELGRHDESENFRHEQLMMNQRINRYLWNEALDMYCDRYWQSDSKVIREKGSPIPSGCLLSPDGLPGLKGEYFSGIHFDTLKLTRLDKEINNKTIKSVNEIGDTYYSIRWTGQIIPKETKWYVFSLSCNDGARLWVDGDKLIDDNWIGHQLFVNVSRPVLLNAGQKINIRIDYYQGGGSSDFNFGWYEYKRPAGGESLHSDILTYMNFFPLICAAPDQERAEKILKVLRDRNKFWGKFVCPTVARDNPAFADQQYWRGTIWAPANYLIYQGLKRYASADLLNEFSEKSVNLFMTNWLAYGRSYENFYADGRGGRDPYYTWGTLLCLIGIENICDLKPNGELILNGSLNKNITIKNLPMNAIGYDVESAAGRTELRRDGMILLEARGQIVRSRHSTGQ